ncbi:hypothetical protein [Lysinibacillus xylanilyticus]|uniref:hypothetical protein n=1 Tax=Lysinibacillus xylanilyticus TaxID=582475 RepID=UPI00083C928A|nr:hypothetical protein [Lysinibacillus xylanilyticus]
MITINDFNRIGEYLFRFIYNLGEITYSSVVSFKEACTDAHFNSVFPLIQENLLWLEQSVDTLMDLIEEKLPENVDVNEFKQLHIVSFSLNFEENSDVPIIQIAYGDDGVYLIVGIKEQQIFLITLNEE